MEKPSTIHPLRTARMAKGLTLQKAADKVGCTKTAWCDWELGKRVPNRTFMPRVCGLTGLQPNDFYTFTSCIHANSGQPTPAQKAA
ncbi:helix-turn-helix domain-containing protein [Sphingomonas histidinilytica]|uniref:helix-turn-helix domain-containing protein n=1 Tax=Rhizorhabdus histidinilytica TaxID=439228 RepID=UPI0039A5EB43|nr:helix-turn-helix domain-containing protein [Rhizorhabdus histidinilytica]